MIPQFLKRLQEFSPLSEATQAELQQYLSVVEIPKGEFILKYHEVCRYIFYIEKGFARQYYFRDGKEITEWFAGTHEFCFSISSYFDATPSNLLIEAVEESTVIRLHRDGILQLSKTNPEIAQLALGMFARSLKFSQLRTESILFQSARDRYLHLLETKPYVIQKVSLAHIASFLGISQETLSRIRAKI
ncbi:Crp/Fnr family transcriptional regulator [Leeuwenhoekiella sp. H156]|uniref:Crp/Fnr family transcriptional regulator n=1 Tax=Leeuwenhoekiella sp. H156 TaxID=3450128 RepID=UPI003FA40E5B